MSIEVDPRIARAEQIAAEHAEECTRTAQAHHAAYAASAEHPGRLTSSPT